MPGKKLIYGNGIAAEGGGYGTVLDIEELYETIMTEPERREEKEQKLLEKLQAAPKTLGPPPSVAKNAGNLSKTKWGIIWPHQASLPPAEKEHIQALRAKLEALVNHRLEQMDEEHPWDFEYKPGQHLLQFLKEQGLGVHQFCPETLPYYLLIVGSPEQIPWRFQQELDLDYAVGRLWFDDVADCEQYVQHLLSYEKAQDKAPTAQEVLFLGTQHPDDPVTERTATILIPLLQKWVKDNGDLGFGTDLVCGDVEGGGAFKSNVLQRLSDKGSGGHKKKPPALLFTASHGLEFTEKGAAGQIDSQGALILQDLPGVLAKPQPKHYLTGDEVTDLPMTGTLAFCYACFGAGTPLKSDWQKPNLLGKVPSIADKPFVARLPQKMLGQGLLAFVGHVSKQWEHSYLGPARQTPQVQLYSETLGEILAGQRVGHALNWLNERWERLTALLDCEAKFKAMSKEETANLWITRNDLRGFVILGDPAARLRLKLWD